MRPPNRIHDLREEGIAIKTVFEGRGVYRCILCKFLPEEKAKATDWDKLRGQGRHWHRTLGCGTRMMNIWYAHYLGYYGRDTAHLSLVQRGAYRLLLDHYYATAAPQPGNLTTLYRICRAFDEAEHKAVDFVVAQFFELRADGYHNARADVELAKRAEIRERLSDSGRRGAKKRWAHDTPASNTANGDATDLGMAKPQSHPQSQSSVTPIRERKASGDL